jgi:hypothetical protein
LRWWLLSVVSKAGVAPGGEETELDQHYAIVTAACDTLIANSSGMEAIIVNTKSLTLASTQFVSALKKTANECDDDIEKRRLIDAAKNLATATSSMVGGAKEAARNMNNSGKQMAFKSNVEDLKMMCNNAAGPQLRDRVMYKLSKAVKVCPFVLCLGNYREHQCNEFERSCFSSIEPKSGTSIDSQPICSKNQRDPSAHDLCCEILLECTE